MSDNIRKKATNFAYTTINGNLPDATADFKGLVAIYPQTFTEAEKSQVRENLGITSTSGGGTTVVTSPKDIVPIVYTNLVDGIVTVNHTKGKYAIVAVYNSDDVQIIPSEVKLINETSLSINLSQLGEFTGTLHVVIA